MSIKQKPQNSKFFAYGVHPIEEIVKAKKRKVFRVFEKKRLKIKRLLV